MPQVDGDFWSGLSQGMTQGLLFKQRQDEDKFRQTQDRLIDQIHIDAKIIRLEDYQKMLENIHDLTVAKNEKQLHEAWGKYQSRTMAERYDQEKAAKEYNEGVPYEIEQQPISVAQTPDQRAVGAPAPQFPSGTDAIPAEQRAAMMKPVDSYAQNGIRFRTPEGDMGRQLEFAEAKGEIMTEGRLKIERQRGQAKLAEIGAKAKSAGVKGIRLVRNGETGETEMVGVHANGDPYRQSLGNVQLPQEIVAEMNNKARSELKEMELRQKDEQFQETLKLRKREVEAHEVLNKSRIKEISEKIGKNYWGTKGSGSNSAANMVIRKADSDLRAAVARYRSLESELSKLNGLKASQRTPEMSTRREAILMEMGSITMELDKIQRDRDAQLDAIKDSIPDVEGEVAKKAATGGGTANKKPSLKLDNIREQLKLK